MTSGTTPATPSAVQRARPDPPPGPGASAHPEDAVLALMARVWNQGVERPDRTGTGTRALFGETLAFDLSDGRVPLLTTKKVFWRSAVVELLWFLSGETSILPLVRQGVHIWTDWPQARANAERCAQGLAPLSREDFEARLLDDEEFAARWADLGPVYGAQWRRWRGADGREHDQLARLVEGLRSDPHGRRHLFTAWNVGELDAMALPPCHMVYQYFVADGHLSCLLYQRSCDLGLGFPFNIFEAALLVHMLAAQVGLRPGRLVWTGGDVHLYLNHAHLVETQLGRRPRPWPRLRLAPRASLFEHQVSDIVVEGYDPHPAIAAPVAV